MSCELRVVSCEILGLRVAVPRLCRRHYYVDVSIRGFKSPRLFKFTSFRRFRCFSLKRLLNAHRLKTVWKTGSPKGEQPRVLEPVEKLTWQKKCVWKTRNGNVFNDERISLDKSSCRLAALTSFKLLTFCIVQASMDLLSLNNNFLRCHYCVDLSLFIPSSSHSTESGLVYFMRFSLRI